MLTTSRWRKLPPAPLSGSTLWTTQGQSPPVGLWMETVVWKQRVVPPTELAEVEGCMDTYLFLRAGLVACEVETW